MPYQKGNRLPGEKASKLGHLEVIKCPLVKRLCQNFEDPDYLPDISKAVWQPMPLPDKELNIIFSSDGSIQNIESPQPPYKAIAFVKTALLKLDQYAIAKLDKETPNPFALKDAMEKATLFHSTAFPHRYPRASSWFFIPQALLVLNPASVDTRRTLVSSPFPPQQS